jgi:endonuclease YncB( thermonuclease family)
MEDLQLLDESEKLSRFTLYGIETFGKVVSIHDGDTFDMCLIVPLKQLTTERPINKRKKGICLFCDQTDSRIVMRMRCRLDGIDARELKDKRGQKAKEILESHIQGKILRCRLGMNDKYGRILITLFVSHDGKEIVLNEHLQQHQEYFIAYDGGTKVFEIEE